MVFESRELFRRRRFDEQRRADARERELFQRIGRAGEVVTIKCQEEFAHPPFLPNFSTEIFSSGYFAAACFIVKPSTAVSHHFLSERTPAAAPSGCAIIPPPAM